MDTLAVRLPNLHLVLYMRLKKVVNPGTQSAPNKNVGKPARKCTLNKVYVLIKHVCLTTSC